ncbi:hypothetical protein TNCV_1716591 [Trichonephila clavipes]|nr:hypothetical protein TNCV_1716591 [Trichonephila clavipes]
MLVSRTVIYLLDVFTVNIQAYKNVVIQAYARLLKCAKEPRLYIFMNDKLRPRRADIVDEFFEDDIRCMDCLSIYTDLNAIKYAWEDSFLSVVFLPRPTQELKVKFLEEWALLPQTFVVNLINSMAAYCEARIAMHDNHTSYYTYVSHGNMVLYF